MRSVPVPPPPPPVGADSSGMAPAVLGAILAAVFVGAALCGACVYVVVKRRKMLMQVCAHVSLSSSTSWEVASKLYSTYLTQPIIHLGVVGAGSG
jgi:hypothetical protein